MQRISKSKKSSLAILIFGVCNLLQKSVPFILMPFLTRYLTTTEYGVYSIYNAWLLLLTVFATLNLHLGGFNNGLCKYSKESTQYTVSIISLCAVITMFFFGVVYGIESLTKVNFLELPNEHVILMFIYILCVQGLNCWIAKARYNYEFKSLLCIMTLSFLMSVILPFGVMLLKGSLWQLILAIQLPNVCIGIGCFIICFRKEKYKINTKYWQEALRFNVPLLPHYISGMILNQSDRIMIQRMCGEEKVAYYSVAYNLSSVLNLAINSVNSALVPNVYHALSNGDCIEIKKKMKSFLCIAEVGILLVMLIMPEVVPIIASNAYANAIQAIPPIVISSYFMFLYNLFANVEFYYESKYYISFASVLAAVLNVLLNYICIPKYGYFAAAYTTGICYLIYALMHMLNVVRLTKKKKVESLFDYKNILWSVIRLIVLMFFIIYIYEFVWLRYIVIIFMMFICGFVFRKKFEIGG